MRSVCALAPMPNSGWSSRDRVRTAADSRAESPAARASSLNSASAAPRPAPRAASSCRRRSARSSATRSGPWIDPRALAVADRRDAAPGRNPRIGQVDPDRVVVAHAPLGGIQRRPRGRLAVAHLGAQLARRHLRRRACESPATIRGTRFSICALRPIACAVRDLGLGLDAVALLAPHHLRRGALGLPRGVLLGIQPRPATASTGRRTPTARSRTARRCRPSARAAPGRG